MVNTLKHLTYSYYAIVDVTRYFLRKETPIAIAHTVCASNAEVISRGSRLQGKQK